MIDLGLCQPSPRSRGSVEETPDLDIAFRKKLEWTDLSKQTLQDVRGKHGEACGVMALAMNTGKKAFSRVATPALPC